MTKKKAFVSGHNYIQDIHMEPGVYTVLMKVNSMYGDVCSFALFDGTTWTHYDMDTVKGQWKWAYVTFRTLVPMTKINLISRNYSAGLPVFVVEPQIVAGNVPFDAGVSPADLNKESKELQSILQSMEYLKLAIGQDAEINGALVTLVTMLLKQDMNADVTAGISGIQLSDINDPDSPKNAPAFWSGGTYAEAISNIAKAIIRHDGSVKFTDAEITGTVNATSGVFTGALASPFERAKSTYTKDFSNNIIVTGDEFFLPWTPELGSGRIIRLVQPNPGTPYCIAPTGKYFFEDGVQKSRLDMLGAEIIELLGFTDGRGVFTGWLVLNRGLMKAVSTWGEPHRIVAHGRIRPTNLFKFHTFDGSTLSSSISEFNSRKYTSITMPEKWFDSIDGYYVKIIANGGDSAAFHTVEKNTSYTFRVYQHSLNVANGTLSPTTTFDFYFEVYSAAWLYPNSGAEGMPGVAW